MTGSFLPDTVTRIFHEISSRKITGAKGKLRFQFLYEFFDIVYLFLKGFFLFLEHLYLFFLAHDTLHGTAAAHTAKAIAFTIAAG